MEQANEVDTHTINDTASDVVQAAELELIETLGDFTTFGDAGESPLSLGLMMIVCGGV